MTHYSPRAKTLALLPKFTGFLSLCGSFFIFQDVVFHKKPIHRVYHRLVLGLSCSDMIASIVNILSTWPIPEGSAGVYLASGTTQTCTAQGFFNELGNLATPLYNASLCAYYVLVVRDGWMEDHIRTKAEPWMHLVPATIAFTIAILGIPFTLYNNSGWLCWIAAFPAKCQGDTCTRGEHADIFRWVHYAIIWSAILSVTLGMYSIYRKVRQQERIQSQERDDDAASRGRKSKKVAIQAALFVGALYLTWIFTTITRIYQITTGNNNFVLLVLMATFFPLQGFFNCLIYLRPRYLRCRSRNPDAPVRQLLKLSLYHESHPIHGLQQNRGPPGGAAGGGGTDVRNPQRETEEERRRRRSSTASFYSMGNSKLRNSDAGEGGDDASYSINTVNAIASVSDYNHHNNAAPPRTGEEEGGDDRVSLTDRSLAAVEEASTTSDSPVPSDPSEQEMVDTS
eukprot:CAMPEP_0172535842 /NCGR_PEP_ID=MMETSP1067-20121228/7677_1 /TAXON_ID=265564 ORGANISM="Thalassiosira punctigera, Strain Tpunct2005C2" /NCGR_SAMPLE_ID=MMETSP1067 /ASSEMBLY_ACC=CAM_ASM_000444 /LENGTH=453 /DNA_ID=CAMNT_0013320799 /DNA_START=364 /DNA_END=1725 /DNA_ORIENTATION=+